MKKKDGSYYSCAMTVYLAKDKVKNFLELIKKDVDGKPVIDNLVQKKLKAYPNFKFVYQKNSIVTPLWYNHLFSEFLGEEDEEFLSSRSVQAVLFIKSNIDGDDKPRFFAVCYGNGRYMLDQDNLEKRFGLRSSLNMVEPRQLRSVDYTTFGSVQKQSRIQSSQLTELDEFSFDSEQDLIRAVTGRAAVGGDEELRGRLVSGNNSFHVTTGYDLDNIEDILKSLFNTYKEEEYKYKFPGIENIKPLDPTDKLVGNLTNMLYDSLLSKLEIQISFSVPEITDRGNVDHFVIKIKDNETDFDDLDISVIKDVLVQNQVDKDDIIDFLDKITVRAVDGNGVSFDEWKCYKCFYTEVKDNTAVCFLHAGEWYKIDKGLYNDVDVYFQNNLGASSKLQIPLANAYKIKNKEGEYTLDEGYYNSTMGKHKDFLKMDRQNVNLKKSDKFEFCDLIYCPEPVPDILDLIHVKVSTHSSMLSHLFNQGEVAGNCMLDKEIMDKIDEKFQKTINKTKPEWENRNLSISQGFKPQKYRIVYAIIDSKDRVLDIPFFSKLVFRSRATTLKKEGYDVAIVKIPVNKEVKVEPVKPFNSRC